MELLAPAGSRQALTAAVQSGADAVYLAARSSAHVIVPKTLQSKK